MGLFTGGTFKRMMLAQFKNFFRFETHQDLLYPFMFSRRRINLKFIEAKGCAGIGEAVVGAAHFSSKLQCSNFCGKRCWDVCPFGKLDEYQCLENAIFSGLEQCAWILSVFFPA